MRAPKCNGDARFTADQITTSTAGDLAEICAACDVALLCRQYAKAAKRTVGFWAGNRYPSQGAQAQERRPPGDHARPKRDPAATATTKRIEWCCAHAARLRDRVARGEHEPWYLDAAAHFEAEADQHERASKAA